MKRTMQLEQSVLQDVVALLDNKDALRKLQSFLLTLKKEEKNEEMSVAEKKEILKDIREGLQELRAAQNGKIELQSAREFLHEIRS